VSDSRPSSGSTETPSRPPGAKRATSSRRSSRCGLRPFERPASGWSATDSGAWGWRTSGRSTAAPTGTRWTLSRRRSRRHVPSATHRHPSRASRSTTGWTNEHRADRRA
jgi:hypothetical protein